MSKTITILFLFFSLGLNANDGFPEAEKKETQTQTLLNSNHNHNSTTVIQVKEPEKEKSTGDKFYQFLKDWSGTIVGLVGFIGGYALIRRKFIESHITKMLIDIHDANKILQEEVTNLIDLYVPKTYTNEYVHEEELNDINESIMKLFKLSQKGSSDVQTTLFYLKFTIQQTIKNKDHRRYTPIISREIYGIILMTLDRVTFLLSQVVQAPSSIRVKSMDWFDDKELKNLVNNSEFNIYSSFRQGLDHDANSALYFLFYRDILYKSNTLFMRSAFQIYEDTIAISHLLFKANIYAPLTISASYGDEQDVQTLYLVGFRPSEEWLQTGGIRKYVKLIYSNPSDFMLFTDGLTKEQLKTRYHDDYLPDSGFSMKNLERKLSPSFETIVLYFDLDYMKELFKKNEDRIKMMQPKKIGLIRKSFKRLNKKFSETKWW